MGELDAYKILVRKPTRKRPLRRPKDRGEESIKIKFREKGDNVDWIHLAQWPEKRERNLTVR
jgi:hypothetical protein